MISEPVAHICGFAAGIATFFAARHVTDDRRMQVKAAMIASVLCNAVVGGKINLVLHDVVSLVLLRPLSGYLGAKLIEIALDGHGESASLSNSLGSLTHYH